LARPFRRVCFSTMPSSRTKKRIYVVDDDEAIRDGVAKLFSRNPDYVIVGSAGDATEALALARRHAADAAFIDLYLPGFYGFTLINQLLQLNPNLRIIVYTGHDDEYFALSALRAGARGFVSKSEPAENLFVALHTVFSGELYLDLPLRSRLLSLVANTPDIELAGFLKITPNPSL
jgi:two-component system, NarL family, invasion response regulator UvrY